MSLTESAFGPTAKNQGRLPLYDGVEEVYLLLPRDHLTALLEAAEEAEATVAELIRRLVRDFLARRSIDRTGS